MVRRSGCLRPETKREPTMKISASRNYVMAVVLAAAACCAWPQPPGALGIETGRTIKGRLVIFAWFENKKALVDWYKSDFHMGGAKWAFPNQTFDREPLPDMPENSGQILALVTLKFAARTA